MNSYDNKKRRERVDLSIKQASQAASGFRGMGGNAMLSPQS